MICDTCKNKDKECEECYLGDHYVESNSSKNRTKKHLADNYDVRNGTQPLIAEVICTECGGIGTYL